MKEAIFKDLLKVLFVAGLYVICTFFTLSMPATFLFGGFAGIAVSNINKF